MLEDKGVDTVEMEVVVEVVEEERRHEVKKPKKLKKPKKIKIPHGPFVLDKKKVEEVYKLEPPHIKIIKNLPRIEKELFLKVENKINPCKNQKFLSNLHNGSDTKTTIAAYQLTEEEYKEVYGEEWANPWKKPTCGATGGRGKDTLEMAVLKVKSPAWVKTINTAFNYLCDFVYEKEEFRCVDWTSATAEEFDVILGYFWSGVGKPADWNQVSCHQSRVCWFTDVLKFE